MVKALRAHDNILAEELDSIRLELGKRTYKSPPKLTQITFDIPVGVDVGFSEALKTKIVESASSSWLHYFGLLDDFKAIHGHCNVPKRSIENLSLAWWVGTQRKLFRKKSPKLTPERIAKLDTIGLEWDLKEIAWEEKFIELCEFTKVHGHCIVPTNYEENPSLGRWISSQRLLYNKNKLSVKRSNKLNAINFVFELWNESWQRQFDNLYKFKLEYGHCNVPKKFVDKQLVTWVVTQRERYKKNELTAKQREQLDDIGFQWEHVADTIWNTQYTELCKFKKAHGHCKVPKKYAINQSLALWVGTQRRKYNLKENYPLIGYKN